jgi:hypothetical protein
MIFFQTYGGKRQNTQLSRLVKKAEFLLKIENIEIPELNPLNTPKGEFF